MQYSKQLTGIVIMLSSPHQAIRRSYAGASPTMVLMRARSIRAATMGMPAAPTRGVRPCWWPIRSAATLL